MTPIDIIEGYQLALNKCLEVLPSLVCHEIKDVRNEEEIFKAIRASVMSKQYGHEDFLAKLITKACSKSGYNGPLSMFHFLCCIFFVVTNSWCSLITVRFSFQSPSSPKKEPLMWTTFVFVKFW